MSRPRPTTLLLLGLLSATALVAPSARAQDGADDKPAEFNDLGLRMTAEVVFDGKLRSNRWACALVEVENVGEPVDGALVIEGGVVEGETEPVRYSRPIDVGRKARKRVFLYFDAEGWGQEWTVELVGRGGAGAPLARAQVRVTTAEVDDVVIAVVGEDPMGLNAIREAWPGAVPGHPAQSEWERRRVHLSLVQPDGMPDRWVGYDVVDVLVWPQPDLTGLTDEQVEAVIHFVGLGGTLVVPVTDGWQRVRESALADVLPVTLDGAAEVPDAAPLLEALAVSGAPIVGATSDGTAGTGVAGSGVGPLPVLVADARAADGSTVLARDGDRVLWAVRDYGLGRVVFLGLDPTLRPIKGSPDRATFWRHLLWLPEPPGGQRDVVSREQLLGETLGSTTAAMAATADADGPFRLEAEVPLSECVHDADRLGTAGQLGFTTGYYYGTSALDGWFQEIRRALADIPALQPLPMGWIVLFSLAYLLCIGPLDYVFLRLIGRQEWTWLTFPLLIGVFFTAAVVGTTAAKGRKAVMTRVEVVDVFEPEGFWRGESFVGVFSSQRTDLTVRSERADSLMEPMRRIPDLGMWWGGDQLDPGFMKRPAVQVGRGGGALGYRADTWTMAYLQSAWADRHGAASRAGDGAAAAPGHFQLRRDGDARVTVINGTDVNLHAAVLLFPENAYDAEALREALGDEWAWVAGLGDGGYGYGGSTAPWGGGSFRTHAVGPLLAGGQVTVDLDAAGQTATAAWPELPDDASLQPRDREDWTRFREVPGAWERGGHLDLTRALMDGQLVLVGFTSTPVEPFALEGLDPVSEPRTVLRVVLGEDPRRRSRDGEVADAGRGDGGRDDLLVAGVISRAQVEAVLAAGRHELRSCYDSALWSAGPELRARFDVKMVIGADGSVWSVEVEHATPGAYVLESCMTSTLYTWRFPASDNGGMTVVKTSLSFAPEQE